MLSQQSYPNMNVLKYRILTGLYCALILTLSSLSFHPSFVSKWDKVIHFTEYAILGALLLASVEQRGVKIVLLIVAIGSIFAGLDEMWQSMIPTRIPSVYDWLADTGGLFVGATFSTLLFRYKILRYNNG